MEQEPVYVTSGRLTQVCEGILARIYDIRQTDKEDYVSYRVREYNSKVDKINKYRKFMGWLGFKPKYYVTPHGMELQIREELSSMDPAKAVQHPIVQIHRQYGELEDQTKDCLLQAAINDSVLVSAGMVRGISHLGIPLDFMAKPKFGFHP